MYYNISDYNKQTATTVYCNIMHVIEDMDPSGKLVAYFGICDGCNVQYICSQVLNLLFLLSKSKWINVYQVIMAPGHCKSRIDAEVGEEKTHLEFLYGNHPLLPEEDQDINVLQVAIHKYEISKRISLAKCVYQMLC